MDRIRVQKYVAIRYVHVLLVLWMSSTQWDLLAWVGPRKDVLNVGSDPPMRNGKFGENGTVQCNA